MSASSFGFRGGRKLTTYTFASGYSNFTVPAGVTKLLTVIGSGAAGTWTPPGGTNLGTGKTYSDFQNRSVTAYNTIVAAVPSSANSQANAVAATIDIVQWFAYAPGDATNGVYERNSTYNPTLWYWTGGSIGSLSYNNYAGLTGSSLLINVTTGSGADAIVNNLNGYMFGSWYSISGVASFYGTNASYSAPSTTGFGLTFTGTSPSTYYNVAVTPGNTYSINNNGSLTITY
jgi:hypothetical protein